MYLLQGTELRKEALYTSKNIENFLPKPLGKEGGRKRNKGGFLPKPQTARYVIAALPSVWISSQTMSPDS